MINEIGGWFTRHCIYHRYKFSWTSASVIKIFKKLISRKAFHGIDTVNALNGIREVLLYFLFNYNNTRLILFIFNFDFYRLKGLTTTENTIFKVEYQYILQYESIVNVSF